MIQIFSAGRTDERTNQPKVVQEVLADLKMVTIWGCLWSSNASNILDICSNFRCFQSMWLCNSCWSDDDSDDSDDDKKTNLANLAPSHRKRPQFSNCHLEYFFSINYKSVSSGALKFTPICPLFHCCPSGRLLQQIIVIWNIYSRSSTNPCHVYINFPLFSSGISSQHIIVFWNIAWLSLSFKV